MDTVNELDLVFFSVRVLGFRVMASATGWKLLPKALVHLGKPGVEQLGEWL